MYFFFGTGKQVMHVVLYYNGFVLIYCCNSHLLRLAVWLWFFFETMKQEFKIGWGFIFLKILSGNVLKNFCLQSFFLLWGPKDLIQTEFSKTLQNFSWSIPWIFLFQTIYHTMFGYPNKNLNGELALITGGGGGLGRLLALRLVRLGCKVIIWDINQDGK